MIIIYGARGTDKTTLIQNLFKSSWEYLYLNCGETRIQSQLIPDSLELENTVLLGSYPEIFNLESKTEKIWYLISLPDSTMYKDILMFNLVKKSKN